MLTWTCNILGLGWTFGGKNRRSKAFDDRTFETDRKLFCLYFYSIVFASRECAGRRSRWRRLRQGKERGWGGSRRRRSGLLASPWKISFQNVWGQPKFCSCATFGHPPFLFFVIGFGHPTCLRVLQHASIFYFIFIMCNMHVWHSLYYTKQLIFIAKKKKN